MKIRPFAAVFCILLSATLSLQADTYVLKNGRKLEADLIRETKDSYILEVKLAETIKEEREIPKADVVRIVKPEKGMKEYLELREMVPAPDGLKSWEYKQRVETMTRFLETYPSHSRIREVIEMRNELRDEMRKVEDGARKIDGILYPATELRENAYELDARIEARKIKDLVAQRNYLLALRAYYDFADEYGNTRVNEDLVPLIHKVIDLHVAQATEWLESYEDRVAEREKGLAMMQAADQRESRRAIQEEEDALQRRYQTESATRIGWVTTHPFCRQSLENTIQFAKSESRRIDNLLARKLGDAGEMYRELYRLYHKGADENLVRTKLREAQKLRIPNRYLEQLTLVVPNNS